MTIHCPCCGHEMASIPVDVLNTAPLPPQMRTIVMLLADAYPKSVTSDAIWNALYGLDPNGGPDNPGNLIAVQIWRARKCLEPYGWTIPKASTGRGNHGRYRLVAMAGDEKR